MDILRKHQDSANKNLRSPFRQFLLILLAVLLVITLGGTLLLGRVGLAGWSAYQQVQATRSLMAGGLSVQSLAALQRQLELLSDDLTQLSAALRPLQPLLQGMGERRLLGVEAAAAPAFVEAGGEAATLAADFLALMRASSADPAQPFAVYLLQTLTEQAQAAGVLAGRAQAVQSALLALDGDALPPEAATWFEQMTPLITLLEPALLLAPSLSSGLGYEEPTHYLILVQNNQEVRATGGFISGVGLVTLNDGEIVDLSFSDSYAVDNMAVAHPAAPPAMQRYLDAPLIFLRDTNWSPHFSISARTAQAIYARDQGVEVDGVISVDLRALELLMHALGPVQVADWEEPLTAENVLETLMTLWAAPATTEARIETNIGDWWQERKSFMGIVAEALLLRSGQLQGDELTVLASALHQALSERAIQLWLQDERAAHYLAEWGWDGGLRAVPGSDYLSLIDSNVGFNKVNAVVERRLAYSVEWPQGVGQAAQATVTVTYTHPIEMPDHLCNRRARYGVDYQEMMRRCYFNYVRVYVPRGSELQSTSGLEDGTQESQPGEAGTTVFAGYFVLKPGESHTVQFTYRLPAELQPGNYRLILQRQSGSAPLPITWNINGAQGETVVAENWIEKN